MAEAQTDYYTLTTRSMLKAIREVGAMPFALFQYYLTYQNLPEIRPSLITIALDLGIVDKHGKPSKSAVCNLKKILIDKEWIKEENGQIFILKSFRNSERDSEKVKDDSEILNGHSEKMNESFRNSERPYIRNENKNRELKTEKKEGEETPARETCEALELFEASFGVTVGKSFAQEIRSRITNLDVWRILIRDKIGYADKPLEARQRIETWILSAYNERIEKENGKNQQPSANSSNSAKPTAGSIIRNRSYRNGNSA